MSAARSFTQRIGLVLVLALAMPSLLAVAQEAKPARDPADTALLTTIIGLDFKKQRAVYDRLGFDPGDDFWNCVCVAGRYGSSSSSQFYHPDTIGTYDDRYSCNHPGDPCIVAGFGCGRYPLPSDPALWEGCGAATTPEGGENPLDGLLETVKSAVSGDPLAQAGSGSTANPRSKECALRRKQALSKPSAGPERLFRDVPVERQIYAVSPEMAHLLESLVESNDVTGALDAAGKAGFWLGDFAARRPELLLPDQIDMRVDVSPEGLGGGFEIGFGLDDQGRPEPQEIVLKMEMIKDGPNAEIGIGIGLQDGDWTKPEFNGKFKLGFSVDGKVEVKYGISVDTALTTDDFYDGEWQTQSEYRLVRWIEEGVARMDFYVGGALGVGPSAANIGAEATWTLRDRYTAGVFDDMTTALDNLLENQKIWEDRRHDMIAQEAKAWGIDTTCMAPGEMISAVRAAYQEKLRTDPATPQPFEKLRGLSRERMK